MPLDPAIADVLASDKLNAPSHAGVHADIKSNLERLTDGIPFIQQVALTGGPTSSTTVLSLGNIVVPAVAWPTIQYPSAFWTGFPDDDGENDSWQFTIRDNSIAGAVRGGITNEHASSAGAVRLPFSIPFAGAQTTPASTARTYHFCIQRTSGDGTITDNGNTHYGSVLVLPDFS